MTLKLGFGLPQTRYFGPRDVVTAARALEDIGYDSLWVFERILFPADQSGPHGLYGAPDAPWPDRYRTVADPLLTLTAAAAVTSRASLGSCVLLPPLHMPFALARSLATLDALSEGRVLAGLGTGWSIDEYAAAAPRPFAERGAALDEFLDIAAAVWGPDPVAFANERYRIGPAEVGPKPARRIPVLLAGSNRRALSRVARRADGWLMTGAPPSAVEGMLGQVREMAAEAGRDPKEIGCYFQMAVSGFTERTLYGGTVPQLVEDLAALVSAGADHVFIQLPTVTSGLAEYLDHAAELHTAAARAGLI
ncbi:TIGR03619 family F420-dependent LLM class oxidoreductase [Actinoplanes sp. NPDC051411]|uniref:TIGR03619 family F420-dependent LLM class oxidoreductase n=1 Tax=Actinoplanes sp. NPDC051411 TaxID=3155522 RepID=UPI003442F68D